MSRPATPDVKITEALQPVAEPVRIEFRHPAGMGPSPLHGVAQALSSLSSDLASWGQKQQAQQEQEDQARGMLSVYQQTEGGYAEGVRENIIPADRSPAFVRGAGIAAGMASGVELDGALGSAYNEWGDKTNPDPAAFESWFRTTVGKHIPLNTSGAFARGLAPNLQRLHEKYHSKYQQDVTRNVENTALANYGAALASTVDDMQQDSTWASSTVSKTLTLTPRVSITIKPRSTYRKLDSLRHLSGSQAPSRCSASSRRRSNSASTHNR